MPYNKYGIGGFESYEKGTFAYDWLGAAIKFKLLDQWVNAIVIDTDGHNKTITVEFYDNNKKVSVEMFFWCAKKIENN